MDAHCRCDACDFDFHSGHSHHEGTQPAICLRCLASYELVTKSKWGPDYDEIIPVHRVICESVKRRGRNRHLPSYRKVSTPTGQQVLALAHSSGRGVEINLVDELECVECRQRGGIVLYLNGRDACPKCGQGKLKCIEILY